MRFKQSHLRPGTCRTDSGRDSSGASTADDNISVCVKRNVASRFLKADGRVALNSVENVRGDRTRCNGDRGQKLATIVLVYSFSID